MSEESPRAEMTPTVSVIVASYNASRYIAHAISSIQKQTLRNIEIIVSDDASTDDSVEIVTRLMSDDARIRLVRGARNCGPAAARNRALDVARGQWIAVVDSDDYIHPTRLATLLDVASRDGADIVADDLLFFDSEHSRRPTTLLNGRWARRPFSIEATEYVRLNKMYGAGPFLGYLKPFFRSDLIVANSVRYDENLRIGEDYSFVLALLRQGARFRVYPLLLYFYRRHASSISHRLETSALVALKTAAFQLLKELTPAELELRGEVAAGIRSIDRALAYEAIIGLLKMGNWRQAMQAIIAHPSASAMLRLPLLARLRRLWAGPGSMRSKRARPQACILSRQRVVGRTNGSSVYLLDLAQALAGCGVDVHFLSPSPTTLGRWPYLKLSDDLSFLKSVRIRGTWRLGRLVVSADPQRLIRGTLALLDIVLLRLGLSTTPYFNRDPYSIKLPLTRRDQLYIARYAPHLGDFLIADYCFLTDALPYALRPDAPSAVVMHDRFSRISLEAGNTGGHRGTPALTEVEECELLSRADFILAIQWDEADYVRRRLPGHRVVVTPMAAHPAEAPQPGRDGSILFVGSSAAPNVEGIRWFIENCWDSIRSSHPSARLSVAGTVTQFMGPMPNGIQNLGFVDSIDPLYEDAAVIISPLRSGTGLKIKLIEALGHGKSIVGTSKTVEGVEEYLADAIVVEDEPADFSEAVVALLDDRKARLELASRGLAKIKLYFSPEKCYEPFLSAFLGRPSRSLVREELDCEVQSLE
jgi:glycosyltransferase involved in cell wall biosynthesis